MKVTLQESLTRAGLASNQFSRPQQQDQPPGDTAEMGIYTYGPSTADNLHNYPTVDQLNALFGHGGPASAEELETDLDDADSPSPEEYEAFVNMLSGFDIPMPYPPPVSGKPGNYSSLLGKPAAIGMATGTTEAPQGQTVSNPSSGADAPMATDGQNAPYPATVASVETAEPPKIQIRLRKAADAAPREMSSEDGLQVLENLLTRPAANPMYQAPTVNQPQTVDVIAGTSQNAGQSYPPSGLSYSSVSPAPSSIPEEMHTITIANQDGLQTSHGGVPSPHDISSASTTHKTSSRRKMSTKKTTQTPARPEESSSPDTSVYDKPVKTRPVDVDSVAERNRKNAIQARINRQKKKEFMENLQGNVDELQAKNEELVTENTALREETRILKEELQYVKNVLANQSALAGLLKDIGHSSQARLSSSFFPSGKRTSTEAELSDYQPAKLGGGVCLHVDKDDVSIEMCSKCSKMSSGASKYDHGSQSIKQS